MSGDNVVIKVSAPGKVILHGEHAVVYGKLAIAASLGLRTQVIIEENNSGNLVLSFISTKVTKTFNLKDLNNLFKLEDIPLMENMSAYDWKNPEGINHDKYLDYIIDLLDINEDDYPGEAYSCVLLFFYVYFGIIMANKVEVVGLNVTVQSDLKIGAGTGSSASFMVSLSGALMRYLVVKKQEKTSTTPHTPQAFITITSNDFTQSERNLISSWAFCGEKFIHGSPSGIDNTICTFGSMVSFRKGSDNTKPSEYNKVSTSQNIQGLLIDTNIPKVTFKMVGKVRELHNKHPKVIDSIFQSIEECTLEALENLQCLGMLDEAGTLEDIGQCYSNLGDMADLNHNLLKALGVSHPALEDVMSILSKRGLHGKITGAGGGGYVVALIPLGYDFQNLDLICQELSEKGYNPIVCKLGSSGVTIDS